MGARRHAFIAGVFRGKSQSNMDDDWGYPYDSGNLQIDCKEDVVPTDQVRHDYQGIISYYQDKLI